MTKRPIHLVSFLLLWLSFMLFSCTDKIEGCLDINARNFQADADRNCCCEWPEAFFLVNHKMGEEIHEPALEYTNSGGQSYRLLDAGIICSDFILHFDDGRESHFILDNITLTLPDNQLLVVPNDVIVITRATAKLKIGEFIGNGKVTHLSFRVGLPDNLQNIAPEFWPADHPLNSDDLGWWDDQLGFASLVTRHLPAGSADTLSWGLHQKFRLEIPINIDLAPGFGIEDIPLSINYSKWFDLQNISTSPDQNWSEQLMQSFN
jgi:hypothetical protein